MVVPCAVLKCAVLRWAMVVPGAGGWLLHAGRASGPLRTLPDRQGQPGARPDQSLSPYTLYQNARARN
eukprot:3740244-Rhodomonas_salina.1